MASKIEEALAAYLAGSGIAFKWQHRAADLIDPTRYDSLYGVAKVAEPDFYLPAADLHVEVKGHMTIHQVSKFLYLARSSGRRYYVYQATEEDWDPTVQAMIPVTAPPPPSTRVAARKAYNLEFQQAELAHLASNPEAAAAVNAATTARLCAYVAFFDDHLRAATGAGLLK